MAEIKTLDEQEWRNYHGTLVRHGTDRRSLAAVPQADEAPHAFLSRTGTALRGLLAEAERTATPIVTLGSTWSFSRVLAGPGIILETKEASAIFALPGDALANAVADPHLVLVSGGTTIAQLNAWLLARGLSLITSGAHDGQTIAGACGTGTHGSVLDYGGFQNHVVGAHLVTGPHQSVWVEQGPEPIVADDYALRFASHVMRGADLLDACRVHLGGLGVINALLLRVTDDFRVAVVRRKVPMRDAWLLHLQEGRFTEFAAELWSDAPAPYAGQRPYYVEVILNPFADLSPVGQRPRPALVTLFYKVAERSAPDPWGLDDVLNLIRPNLFPVPWLVAEVVTAAFEAEPMGEDLPRLLAWGQANGPHRRWPVDLYNAAFAIPQARLVEALGVMRAAFLSRGRGAGPLVFTLRFVEDAAGLLAFTQFPMTAVINLDGLREASSARSAEDVALALELADIPFRQHWGKQGAITPNRFQQGFETPPGGSAASRWRAARRQLLEPTMLPLIGNDALRGWGLM